MAEGEKQQEKETGGQQPAPAVEAGGAAEGGAAPTAPSPSGRAQTAARPAAGGQKAARPGAPRLPDELRPREQSRRKLLRSVMWGSLGLFFLESAGASAAMFWPLRVRGFGGPVPVGRVEDFPVGSVTKVAEGKFYLVRLKEGFIALYWVCPHLGCTVPWSPPEDPGKFHCPCHGSVYEITGQKVAGPAPRSMDYMEITIQDGRVIVDTGKIHQRLNHEPSHVTPV